MGKDRKVGYRLKALRAHQFLVRRCSSRKQRTEGPAPPKP